MPAPLEMFLRAYQSGQDTLTPEMYDYFGGDDILAQLKKYNPGVHWEDADIGGGEGGSVGKGKKLVFADGQIHLPSSKSGIDLLNMRPANWGEGDGNHLKNPKDVYKDENFGDITRSGNIARDQGTLEKALPYIAMAIAMGGPALGAALMGAGIGGGVGFTSAVTGGAAGLGAGNIPGAMGAGTFASGATAPKWATSAIRQGPGALDKINSGNWEGGAMSFLPLLAQQFGIDPSIAKGGMSIADLARSYGRRR